MKKILVMSFLAIALVAVSQQEASAWVNSKFGIGLSYDVQSANTSFLWGLWRNGQIPAPEAFGGSPFAPRYGAVAQPYAPQQAFMPQQGFAPQQGYAPQGYPVQGFAPQGFQMPSNQPYYGSMNYGSPYQFANYPRQDYYYPSNWYGR